jgi:geranylgeranyl diphosphate synthase type I
VAAALELVHNFSLIHDDIQDDDRERRHKPTVWSLWGKPQAINAGTAMRILANRALSRLQGDGVSAEKRLELQCRIDETTLRLIEGQYLDIDFERRSTVRLADYLDMIGGKTAALISCALETGAMVGTTVDGVAARFGEMGTAMGLAFQIRDDILGIWGDPAETGKPAGGDILRKKKSLPVVYALENTSGGDRDRLLSLYSSEQIGQGDVPEVLSLLDRLGARPAAQALVREYSGKARSTLETLGLSEPGRSEFEELIALMAARSA